MVHVIRPRPFEGCFVILGLRSATINLPARFKVSNFIHYEDIKRLQNIENGVVWGSYGSLKVNGNSVIR